MLPVHLLVHTLPYAAERTELSWGISLALSGVVLGAGAYITFRRR